MPTKKLGVDDRLKEILSKGRLSARGAEAKKPVGRDDRLKEIFNKGKLSTRVTAAKRPPKGEDRLPIGESPSKTSVRKGLSLVVRKQSGLSDKHDPAEDNTPRSKRLIQLTGNREGSGRKSGYIPKD